MAQILFVILYNPKQLPTLLDAWHKAGIQGATILRSAGAYSAKNWLQKMGLEALGDLFNDDEVRTKTVFSLFEDDALLEIAIAAAEKAIGSFKNDKTGILFTMPVSYVDGLRHLPKQAETSPPTRDPSLDTAELITRETRIGQLDDPKIKKAILVHPNDPLIEVAEAIAKEPNATIACVVNQRQHLVGLISLRQLMDDLFLAVVPEAFLAESTDFDKVMNFAKLNQTETAGDAMKAPVSVTANDTIKNAFTRMHENQLSGIPVVNEKQEVVGCLDRIELLILYARNQEAAKGA